MEEIIATQYSFLGSQTLIKYARIEFETLIVEFVLTNEGWVMTEMEKV